VHESPAWLTVYVWPPIVTVAVRAAPVFAATEAVTGPEPVPLVGLTVTHVESLAALQLQDAPLGLTVTLAVAPAAGADNDADDSA
jgi:hypothetical protein